MNANWRHYIVINRECNESKVINVCLLPCSSPGASPSLPHTAQPDTQTGSFYWGNKINLSWDRETDREKKKKRERDECVRWREKQLRRKSRESLDRFREKKTLSLLPTLSQSRETRSHRHLLANRENYTRRISSLNTRAGLTALRVITAIWWPSIEFHAAYHYYHLVAINRMSRGVLLLPPSGHQ